MPVVMKLGEPDKDKAKATKAAKPAKAKAAGKSSFASDLDQKTLMIIGGVIGAILLVVVLWVFVIPHGGGDETPAPGSTVDAGAARGASDAGVNDTASHIASPATGGTKPGGGAGADAGDDDAGTGARSGAGKKEGGEGF